VTVRSARPADLPELAELVAATPLWQRYGVTVGSANAALEGALEHAEVVLAAEQHGRLEGLAWVQPLAGFGRSPYLKWLGVAPGETGRGLGRELLVEAERAARAFRPELLLLCSDFNGDGQRFYERNGYVRIGALADYVLTGVAELIYFKRF